MAPPAERCEVCRFWVRDNGWGQCHRKAPAPTIICSTHDHDVEQKCEPVFPRTPANEWCGEFEKAT
jgi:hypothetical protein